MNASAPHLSTPPSFQVWLFIDWTPDAKSTTALNAIYYGALKAGAELAGIQRQWEDADRWQKRAEQVKKALHEKAWDAQRGLFRFDVRDPKAGHFTRHPNVYAAYFGVAEGEELESIGRALAAARRRAPVSSIASIALSGSCRAGR